MWKTAILLMVTLVIAPVLAFRMDEPLTGAQMEILHLLLIIYFASSILCFGVSTVTNNYSQVDKLWSIIPIAYSWVVAWKSGFDSRVIVMAILVSIWGIRLTYNFIRRGGYSLRIWEGEEDYRWAILRAKPEFQVKWKWLLFNLFFISLYQMGLILLFTLPILKAVGGNPWSLWDIGFSILFILLVFIEAVADQQQWEFQNEKHSRQSSGKELGEKYKAGFIRDGLWGIVRHPNYAAEQAIWIVFYFFSVSATGNWINWSMMGCLLLILLFKGSADFSESISVSKYPAYKKYIQEVPRFIPFT